MNKEVVISLSNEATEVYDELNKMVVIESNKGINGSFHQTLFRSIQRAKELLRKDPFTGNQVPQRLIPNKYIKKYDVNNIWRIELANRWRLIYTIRGGELEIINFIIDIFNHKDYDKVFGYKH